MCPLKKCLGLSFGPQKLVTITRWSHCRSSGKAGFPHSIDGGGEGGGKAGSPCSIRRRVTVSSLSSHDIRLR